MLPYISLLLTITNYLFLHFKKLSTVQLPKMTMCHFSSFCSWLSGSSFVFTWVHSRGLIQQESQLGQKVPNGLTQMSSSLDWLAARESQSSFMCLLSSSQLTWLPHMMVHGGVQEGKNRNCKASLGTSSRTHSATSATYTVQYKVLFKANQS